MEEKNSKILVFVISLILWLLFVAFFRTKGKISNDFSAYLIFFLGGIILFFFIFLYKKLSDSEMHKAKIYPMEDLKNEIRKRASDDFELQTIKETQWVKLFGLIPIKKLEKYYVPHMEFTGNQLFYNVRGNWRGKFEIRVLVGKYAGIYQIEASLSRDTKYISSGNFTRLKQSIWVNSYDERKYNPEPPVSRWEQELQSILPYVQGDVIKAMDLARGQQQMNPYAQGTPSSSKSKKKWYQQKKVPPPTISSGEGEE